MRRANGFYFFKSTFEFILLFAEVNMPISAFLTNITIFQHLKSTILTTSSVREEGSGLYLVGEGGEAAGRYGVFIG